MLMSQEYLPVTLILQHTLQCAGTSVTGRITCFQPDGKGHEYKGMIVRYC
jgi:hypothetical protein